jgi:class 3 adenylate cyclase/tetratricopeptide (TPR) repeat protein
MPPDTSIRLSQPSGGALGSSICQSSVPIIPDHELLKKIGHGSYGQVWLARNVLGTYRAVKVVHRDTFRDSRPFEREFLGIRKFEPLSRTHPGLVSILHIGRNEPAGYFYYIMEAADDVASGQGIETDSYVPKTLGHEVASRGALPLVECLQTGLALTSALDYLHKHGLVHRDLKPPNIIFVQGVPKLADIGLVTGLNEGTTCVGTPGYLAPEGPGTALADLFSLGKVLYEISTGKDPQQFPDLPSQFGPLSGYEQFLRFNEIVLKACENNPKNRHQSAEELRAALFQCQHSVGAPAGDHSTVASTGGKTPPRKESERKLLTVLFFEINASERFDPEEAQRLGLECLEIITPLIQRYQGTVAEWASDRVMAVFGAPVACEEHAQRAARAALAIVSALKVQGQRQVPGGLEVRCGIHTGLAIVGSTRDSSQFSVVGDTLNMASRILAVAGPGEVLVSADTHKSIRNYFNSVARKARKLPGLAAPVKLYAITGARELQTRIEAGTQRGLTPFVGRKRELNLLRESLLDAAKRRGQIVLLDGEPGVGKSRLLLEFQHSLEGADVTWLVGRSLSFGNQMAYLPIIDLLKRLFAIQEDDNPPAIAGKIEARFCGLRDELPFALPLIKYLLSADTSDESVLGMDTQQRRIRTFEALRHLILRQAQSRPVVLAIEDLHWSDQSTEDFLVSLADPVATARVVMLLTYRPEYRNPFPERSYVTRMTLRQLNDEESIQLARCALAGGELPPDLQQLIRGKAEGNPFFVEEIINSLLDTGALKRRTRRYELTRPLTAIHVPDTIQDVIMGRIDRLAESPRRALQLASVIGRQFAVSLLATIADLEEPLAEALQKLKSLELIYERSVLPEHTCIFKHALTQEVAYNSLLIQRRKELHCLVAAAIEELYTARLPEFYGLLAYHYERGEEWERALEYLIKAAERSHRVAAYREEAFLLSQAMDIAGRLDQPSVVSDLRARRGSAWARVGMWPQARPDLETALAELPSDRIEQRAELLSDLAGVCFWGMDVAAMSRNAEEGLAVAEKTGRADLMGGLMGWLGAAEQSAGNLAAATEFYERGLVLCRGTASLALYPLNLYLRGRIAEAVERGRESAESSQNLSDTLATAFGHPHFGLALAASGRYREALRVFQEARQFGTKYEVWPFHARSVSMSAGFHIDLYDYSGHEALAEEARELASSADFQASVISACLDLVINFTCRHELGRAEKLIEETAVAMVKVGGWHRWIWEMRMAQARAELALAREDWSGALELAESSLALRLHRGRIKYEVAARLAKAKALVALGRKRDSITELRKALELSRPVGDPAMLLRVMTALLPIDGNEDLLEEARALARKIIAEVPTPEMLRCFETAEPVRQLGSLQ